MKEAVTVAPETVVIRSIPEPPTPGPGETLLAIESVGLCGSDLKLFKAIDPYSHYPVRQGHEYSARVVELGAGYDGPLRPGDLVAVEPLLPCGECIACRRERPNCCVDLQVIGNHVDGALVEQMVVPTGTLHAADGLTASEAAFAEPVSIGLHMVTRSSIQSGDQAVVFGAGPIGLAAVLAARDRGARLLCVDRFTNRLQRARSLGAETVVDASREDVREAVTAWTAGEGPVVVYEATGSTDVLRTAVDIAAHGAAVVVAGTPMGEVAFPVIWLVKKELDVRGSRNSHREFAAAVDLVRKYREVVRPLITHTFPLDQVQEAMTFAISNPDVAEKVVITVGTEA